MSMQPMLLGKAADLASQPVEAVFFGKAQHRGGRRYYGGSSSSKRGNSGGRDDDATCWYCGAQGHRKSACPVRALSDEARRKDLADQGDRGDCWPPNPVLAQSFLAAAF